MRILFLGVSVSSSNRGVLALGASLVGLARQIDPDAKIGLLIGHHKTEQLPFKTGDTTLQVQVIPCRLSPRAEVRDHLFWIIFVALLYRLVPWTLLQTRIARLSPWVEAIADADFVGDIRGGDSFSDIYGFKRFFYGFSLACIVLLVRGSITQLPQTYGPFNSQIARWLARFLLLRSSSIYARDQASRQVVLELVSRRKEVLLSPDVAFSMRAIPPLELCVDPPFTGSSPPQLIGININGLMYNGGYTRNNMFDLRLNYAAFLPKLITALLKQHAGEIWLVPHTFAVPGNPESDPEACQLVREALAPGIQERVRIVVGEYDQHEIKAVIGRCDFFIGSRMHACIAALSQGIPCVGVAYSMKFAGVFETVGMKEWIIDGRDTDDYMAVSRICELHQQKRAVQAFLPRRADEARAELLKAFSHLFLSNPPSGKKRQSQYIS